MKSKYFWGIARLVILLVNVIGLTLLCNDNTNFDVIAGAAYGAVTLFLLLAWLKKHATGQEQLFALNVPFWPMYKYPLAYWLTMGISLLTASVLGALMNMGDPGALQFFGGFLLLGMGITLAVVWACRSNLGKKV